MEGENSGGEAEGPMKFLIVGWVKVLGDEGGVFVVDGAIEHRRIDVGHMFNGIVQLDNVSQFPFWFLGEVRVGSRVVVDETFLCDDPH